MVESLRDDDRFRGLTEERGLDPEALALAFHALRSEGDPLVNVTVAMMTFASKACWERESEAARAFRGITQPAAALARIGSYLSQAVQALQLTGSLDGDTMFIARSQIDAALELLGKRELSAHAGPRTSGGEGKPTEREEGGRPDAA